MPTSIEPVVYIRGRFVPASLANISIYDLGIVLGATITDMLRTFKQQPYRVKDHVRRFYESCKHGRIAPPASAEERTKITIELILRNAELLAPEAELLVAYFITPGEDFIYA